mmetsp:Transcript_31529/g.45934  ORF Transcript_31529/g.45934 Transcript_31529/m.45934 type:complete len:117 (-) Transcript_31529:363-713(-)|eukprot:CAMPEP_0116013570 /NCGR_PEP_ID=MMETSP0321-20121206/5800_1 /TAXON_ID=163516 /ORGANISM="Leptocylindrus danicus var. danicus, Strain B650" /LENGTH=116 /DNA_ID=CAMNT_0003483135 /DNA_START=401 /DNA_END=751 /DNA_ORIENTATION=-
MSTPSFSTDLAITDDHNVTQFYEAMCYISKWKVSTCAPLKHRVQLHTDADWLAFMEATPGVIERGEGGSFKSINLKVLLRECYRLAFSMPPSPLVSYRSPPSAGNLGKEMPPSLAI